VYTGSLSGDNACPKCQAPTDPMIPDGGRFKLELNGLHALFTIVGSLHKIQELEEFRVLIEGVVAQEVESIAFCLRESSFLNSTLINLLVRTTQMFSARGKPTYVISNEGSVLESLQTMNLDQVMKIVPNLERYRSLIS
jgi:hypothetical protein